jgi:hypothetical protein
MDRDNRDQIPNSEGPEIQTGKMINEQNVIGGQRKEINVEIILWYRRLDNC